jgi:replication-associated recombination protein RarA
VGGAEVISSKNKIPCLPCRFSSGNNEGIAQSTCSPFLKAVLHGHHTPVMLWGAPGIGKSQIISQIATGHNTEMCAIIERHAGEIHPHRISSKKSTKGNYIYNKSVLF